MICLNSCRTRNQRCQRFYYRSWEDRLEGALYKSTTIIMMMIIIILSLVHCFSSVVECIPEHLSVLVLVFAEWSIGSGLAVLQVNCCMINVLAGKGLSISFCHEWMIDQQTESCGPLTLKFLIIHDLHYILYIIYNIYTRL